MRLSHGVIVLLCMLSVRRLFMIPSAVRFLEDPPMRCRISIRNPQRRQVGVASPGDSIVQVSSNASRASGSDNLSISTSTEIIPWPRVRQNLAARVKNDFVYMVAMAPARTQERPIGDFQAKPDLLACRKNADPPLIREGFHDGHAAPTYGHRVIDRENLGHPFRLSVCDSDFKDPVGYRHRDCRPASSMANCVGDEFAGQKRGGLCEPGRLPPMQHVDHLTPAPRQVRPFQRRSPSLRPGTWSC